MLPPSFFCCVCGAICCRVEWRERDRSVDGLCEVGNRIDFAMHLLLLSRTIYRKREKNPLFPSLGYCAGMHRAVQQNIGFEV